VIVDGHAHVWTLDTETYPWEPTFGYVPTHAALPDVLLATMDRLGVQHAILVQPSVYGSDHRFLLDAVRNRPDRFLPVGLVDPAQPNLASVADSLVHEGCVGLRVNLSLDLQRAETQATASEWADLDALGVPICLRATPAHHDLVVGILTRHPRLQLVVDHLGLPDAAESNQTVLWLAQLAHFERCQLKIAGLEALSHTTSPYRDVWPLVEAALGLFGSARLLWGSDYPNVDPIVGYSDAIQAIESMPFLSTTDRDRLMARTSLELWDLPPSRAAR
jgi:predicted TIM-barrel fold metal-dependent hydrolase